MRSYAEVPLKTPSGFIIGSYCVVDDKPRDFGDNSVVVLEELAGIVMNHLELLKIKVDHDRADRLIRGLGSYVEGDTALEVDTHQRKRRAIEQQRPTSIGTEIVSQPPDYRSTTSLSSERPPTADRSSIQMTREASSSSEHLPHAARSQSESMSVDGTIERDPMNTSNEQSQWLVSQEIRTAFSRAAHIIRGAMDMQGVVFLVRCTGIAFAPGPSTYHKLGRLHRREHEPKENVNGRQRS